MKQTSVLENSLIWFGAAVSIAEIMTGTYFAPLGFGKGILAIILGHIIGGLLMFFVGLISAKVKKGAMNAAKMSFGQKGAKFFALLNVIQLTGWTGIMIFDGGITANNIFGLGNAVWCTIIGVLIVLWIVIGISGLKKINIAATLTLSVLTIILCAKIIAAKNISVPSVGLISFGAALELSISMPLSWLPVIGDYTKNAKSPIKSTVFSTITYNVISCYMYIIGLGSAIITGENNIASVILKSGLGILGFFIIILSTVTTTFLDSYSGGESLKSLQPKINSKYASITITVLGTICAILLPLDNFSEFLYFIGSVFAPMAAIEITDFFILRNNSEKSNYNITNLIIWAIGFVLYRLLMHTEPVIGYTLVDMLATAAICILLKKILLIPKKQ